MNKQKILEWLGVITAIIYSPIDICFFLILKVTK